MWKNWPVINNLARQTTGLKVALLTNRILPRTRRTSPADLPFLGAENRELNVARSEALSCVFGAEPRSNKLALPFICSFAKFSHR